MKLKFKNLPAKDLTIIISILIGLVFLLGYAIICYTHNFDVNFYMIIPVFLGSVILVYMIVRILLDRFVYRKIKLIYKFIHESKLGKNEKQIENFDDNLEVINKEVNRWAKSKERQLNHLYSLEEYRKNFVGNISHELKTPIFSIQGYLHTLLDGGIYDETINLQYINRAAKNADRLQKIVEDLEEIGKLESGKLILDVTRFDIKLLIKEVFQDLEIAAKEKDISLKFKQGADKNYFVQADRETVRQVLNNLITNSIKYGKDGGQTKISLYDIEENILVEITDNGLGIDEKHIDHLFDRFYRVDSSRSRGGGGSGLGLSIVKHIIEAHNQTINVRSSQGVGSTFGFTLKKG